MAREKAGDMIVEEITLDLGGESVSAALHLPSPAGQNGNARPSGIGFVLAHGAGGDMKTPRLCEHAAGLVEQGHAVLRFNFPYREKGRKSPDPRPRLEKTYRAAAARLRAEPTVKKLFFSGHSMGGRMGTHVAAEGEPCDGLVLFGYPLHPAGGGPLRDEHLPKLKVPVLFVQGTRDALCELSLLRPVLAKMGPTAQLYEVDGADHSLEIKRSSGRDPAEVRRAILEAVDAFVRGKVMKKPSSPGARSSSRAAYRRSPRV
jgi:predicted alpha/beta-hydrolase family hydrolase